MALTETNYSVAWNLVVKRYNNPRLQFMYNMNALYGIEPLSKEIAVDLRNLLNLANLPISTTQAWEHSLGNNVEIPTFTKLEVFLHNRLVSIDLIESRKPAVPVRSSIQSTNHRQTTRPSGNSTVRGHSFHSTLESGSIRCSICQQNRVLRRCPDFLAKDCFARKVIVDRSKACINCLSTSHSLSQCSSNRNCSQCGQRHHTLLHFPNAQQSSSLTPEVPRQHASNSGRSAAAVQNAPSTQLFSAVASHLNSTTLLATALVRIVNNSTGQSALVRALIDHGSEGTLITENIVQALRLKRHPVRAEITGIDPNFIKSGRIDLLIGVDIIPQLTPPDIRKGTVTEPIARNTQLGWIVFGPAEAAQTTSISIRCNLANLNNMVQRFFELDQVSTTRQLNAEEKWCEDHFQQTHIRQPNGKYLVRLPLKPLFDPTQVIGRSRQIALNRFHALERKLNHRPDFSQQYVSTIQEYFDLKQIKEVKGSEEEHTRINAQRQLSISACTVPHHAVIKDDSLTTKMRVVYDASCKTSNGRSLNDILCTGPALQNDFGGVILNWRLHRYVFVADITKMYRCIDMREEDAQYQRIFWRDEKGLIKEYFLTTVTFGTASAPFTAIRVIHQIASDERERYPLAEHVLKKEIYVDDVHETIDGALKIRNDVIAALQSAGMELKKWASNHPDILESIPTTDLSNSSIFEIDNKDSIKTLGLYWHPNKDGFGFNLKFSLNPIFTKRSILSTVARLFDPLGYLAPVIIAAKILLKEVWSFRIERKDEPPAPLDWVDPLPDQLAERWRQLIQELPDIEEIHIPRWLGFDLRHVSTLQLHMFCDGSSMAYAACAYLRASCTDGSVQVNLVAARSRVTPVKPLTIPIGLSINFKHHITPFPYTTAYVKRFIYNTRHKKADRLTGPIQVSEFQQALFALVRMVQQEVYSEELSRLRSNKFLSKHNKLSQLSPFLDDEGLMRVKGRLKNALQLSMSQRTPIILPKAHHLTILVIRNAHHNTLHGGVQLTLSTIHQVFWIVNGKQAVKGILRQCVTCFKHRPSPSSQLMGDLPAHRVNPPKRAFEATGVDYTGAIEIKSSRFRGHTCYKAYIAVFVCLASKAIHLEAVTGMSAQHFLWALQRFIGRRGFCQHLYSDCGTNFISSDKSLKLWTNEFYKGIEETVVPELTRRNIQWHFNPPHSPNFGGLWESNVKAVKTHLYRSFNGIRMTYEQLSTILVQIEACLNSRPLCPLTSDLDDLQALTPAHFLIGDSMMSLPEPSLKDSSLNTEFLNGQRMFRLFWRKWSADWLSHLQARPKWRHETDNLQRNDWSF
ncbi:uncharacterized protein [Drosophila suzukii]|uniref:Integrase catalytic domain-containing protein n=1 Tax=Drosophila suzukii TaxID=28584 RepID=A0ABM4TZK4_DROSZ